MWLIKNALTCICRLEFRYQMYGALSVFFLKLISIAYCICFLPLSFYKCIFLEIIFPFLSKSVFFLKLFLFLYIHLCIYNWKSYLFFRYFSDMNFLKTVSLFFLFRETVFLFFLFLYFPEKYKLFLYISVFLLKTISYSPLYYTVYVYEDV